MTILRKILALILWPFRMIGLGGSHITRTRPRHLNINVAAGRTVAAPWWRRGSRAVMVLAGLLIYCGLQFGLARLIDDENFYQIAAIIVMVVSFVLAVTRPALTYAIWIVLSPFVALFFYQVIGGRIVINFDRLALSLLVIILACRALLNRHAPRKLLAGEWLLVASTVYTYVAPQLTGRMPILYMVNATVEMSVTPLAMYFVTKSVVANKRHVTMLMVAFYVMGMLWAASGFYEHFTGKSWMTPITQAGWGVSVDLGRQDIGKGRAAGPSGHYYTYGEVLALAVLLAFHCSIWTKRQHAKLLHYVSIAFMTIALYYGYSRTPLLAFAAAILLMPLVSRGARASYVALALVFLFAVAAIIPVIVSNPSLSFRFLTTGAYDARVIMLRSGINLVKDNFWFGVGVGNVSASLPRYISDPHHQRAPNNMYLAPHNDYVMILGEQGIFGFLLFLGAIVALTRESFRVRARLLSAGFLGKDVAAIVITFVVMHSICMAADSFRGIQYSYYVLFTLFALVVRIGELESDGAADESRQPAVRPLNLSLNIR